MTWLGEHSVSRAGNAPRCQRGPLGRWAAAKRFALEPLVLPAELTGGC